MYDSRANPTRINNNELKLKEELANNRVQLGLASPLSIRYAQTEFLNALRAVIQAANLRSKLEDLASTIDRLNSRDTSKDTSFKDPKEPELDPKEPLDEKVASLDMKDVEGALLDTVSAPKPTEEKAAA